MMSLDIFNSFSGPTASLLSGRQFFCFIPTLLVNIPVSIYMIYVSFSLDCFFIKDVHVNM